MGVSGDHKAWRPSECSRNGHISSLAGAADSGTASLQDEGDDRGRC